MNLEIVIQTSFPLPAAFFVDIFRYGLLKNLQDSIFYYGQRPKVRLTSYETQLRLNNDTFFDLLVLLLLYFTLLYLFFQSLPIRHN